MPHLGSGKDKGRPRVLPRVTVAGEVTTREMGGLPGVRHASKRERSAVTIKARAVTGLATSNAGFQPLPNGIPITVRQSICSDCHTVRPTQDGKSSFRGDRPSG